MYAEQKNTQQYTLVKTSLILIFLTLMRSAIASPPDLSITSFQLVSSKRISQTIYEYVYRAVLINKGGEARDVIASIGSTPAQIDPIDGEVTFGLVLPGQTVTSSDTITVRHDRKLPFDDSMVAWTFDYSADGLKALEGPPSAPVNSVTRDFYNGDTVGDEELSLHPKFGNIARTKLTLIMNDVASVEDVNRVLSRMDAEITSMLSDSTIFGLRVPDQRTIETLDTLIAETRTLSNVDDIFPEGPNNTKILPGKSSFSTTSIIASTHHHLAVKGHALWNARRALSEKSLTAPAILIEDYFGVGAPTSKSLWSYKNTVAADFGTGATDKAGIPISENHGYQVASVIGAAFDSFFTSVTGLYSEPIVLRVEDHLKPSSSVRRKKVGLDPSANVIRKLVDISKYRNVVLNISLGECEADLDPLGSRLPFLPDWCFSPERQKALVGKAKKWIQAMRKRVLDKRVFVVAAAGNEGAGEYTNPLGAKDAGMEQRALLGPIESTVSPLDNGLVVESYRTNYQQGILTQISPDCTSTFSSSGGQVAGIGESVQVLNLPSSGKGQVDGTSFSSPQVAALAATLWTLKSGLTPNQLKTVIVSTARSLPKRSSDSACRPATPTEPADTAPVIDTYAAVLAIDNPKVKDQAPVRQAILDVDNAAGNATPDGKFTEHDLKRFLQEFELTEKKYTATPPYQADYSRFDLNGDGYTGGLNNRAEFNLDDPFNFTDTTKPVYELKQIQSLIEGQAVTFDERVLTDLQILVYYAYSPLFEGSSDERRALLLDQFHKVGLNLVGATINWKSSTITSAADWSFTPSITLSGFKAVAPFFIGNNGGFETGAPAYSEIVRSNDINAVFFGLNGTSGVPFQISGPFPNRLNFSSFVAAHAGKVWINATVRGFRTSGLFTTFDWEYQTRLYLGDPGQNRAATKSVSIGTVPNSGSFVPSINQSGDTFDTEFTFQNVTLPPTGSTIPLPVP